MIDFEKNYNPNASFIKKDGTLCFDSATVKNIVFTDVSTGKVVLTIPEGKIASIDDIVDKISSDKVLGGKSFI